MEKNKEDNSFYVTKSTGLDRLSVPTLVEGGEATRAPNAFFNTAGIVSRRRERESKKEVEEEEEQKQWKEINWREIPLLG